MHLRSIFFFIYLFINYIIDYLFLCYHMFYLAERNLEHAGPRLSILGFLLDSHNVAYFIL